MTKTQPSINRYLNNKQFDNLDHALGRPLDPLAESYRNRFITSGKQAQEMRASPFWSAGYEKFGSICFTVTDEGRRALKAHLEKFDKKRRLFSVWLDGEEYSPVVAANHGKARYAAWISVSDTWAELTFGEFQKRASVKLAP